MYDTTIPIVKQITDISAEDITTDLKLLNTLIEVNVGNITRLDINIVPIILIPTTIVIAVSIDIRVL